MFILSLLIRLSFGRREPKVTYLQRATTLRASDPQGRGHRLAGVRAVRGKLFRTLISERGRRPSEA